MKPSFSRILKGYDNRFHKNEGGKDIVIIGEVKEEDGTVILNTLVGGKRIVDIHIGDPVPRIC
ncbi:MAG: hypothetical protein JSV09_11995 [Thermoplasmata archaeon]|nr:MAG: hypothetical protein JSV09_11995 [Thermoplasmata archaeon]